MLNEKQLKKLKVLNRRKRHLEDSKECLLENLKPILEDLEKIENEWKYLLIAKLPDFTIKIIGKKGQSCIEQKKVCLSCKKDISQQQGNSKFCSPKYVGTVQAHKCRNENSNKRNNFKNKVSKIISKGVLFVIEPFFVRT